MSIHIMLICQTKEKATLVQHYQTRLMSLFCNTRHWSMHVLHGLHSIYQTKLKSACQQTRSHKFSYISDFILSFTTLCCLSITQYISKPCCKERVGENTVSNTCTIKYSGLDSQANSSPPMANQPCRLWQVQDLNSCKHKPTIYHQANSLIPNLLCVYIWDNTDTYQTFSAEFTQD